MKGDLPKSDQASPVIAVFAMFVLGGLLLIPVAYIFYGGGGAALGGVLILGALIACQSAVFAVGKLFLSNHRTRSSKN